MAIRDVLSNRETQLKGATVAKLEKRIKILEEKQGMLLQIMLEFSGSQPHLREKIIKILSREG